MVLAKKQFHILLIAPGISVHSQRFLQMLLDAGHVVTLIDSHNPKPEGAKRYTFIPYPRMFGLERLGLRTVNRLGQCLTAAQLRLICHRVKPDIVHVHWVNVRAEHCVKARLHPLVLTCWGSDINNLFAPDYRDREYRRRITRVLMAADHVTADSREVLDRCETLARRKIRSSLLYFGIDLGRFKPGYAEEANLLRKQLGISSRTKVLFSVRRLIPSMEHHHILRAFATVVHETEKDAVLVFHRYLAGTSAYEKELRELAGKLAVTERVAWINSVNHDQMPVIYAMSDIVVSFPARDGFPVSFFEAAACKRPVVTSDLKAYEGVFGDSFLMVPPKDVPALTGALSICLTEEPEETQRRVKKASIIVHEIGSQQRNLKVMEEIYRKAGQ